MGTANVTTLFYDAPAPFKPSHIRRQQIRYLESMSSRMVDHLASKRIGQRA